MRRHIVLAAALLAMALPMFGATTGTLTGKFVTPLIGPVVNGTLQLQLSQLVVSPGNYAVIPQLVTCYTSTDGSVVGSANPLTTPTGTAQTGTGSLAAGVYFVKLTNYNSTASTETLAGPEAQFTLNSTGQIVINAPTVIPSGVTGYRVYIGTSSGTETLQGSALNNVNFTQSVALTSGAALPASNNTACVYFGNDAGIPSATYYSATLTDVNQNVVTGFPKNWYLTSATLDVSTLLPLGYPPSVSFPAPVLTNPAQPYPQSIASPLNLNGYAVSNTSNLGPGYASGFFAGTITAPTATLYAWTPNVPITVRALSAFVQSAGVGAGASTFAVTDGTSVCTFPAMLSGTAIYGSSNAPTGTCNFNAGTQLSLQVTADTHASSRPGNIQFTVETTGR
jgi:hypothetical protein